MSLDALVEIIHNRDPENWPAQNEAAFGQLFGSEGGRYPAQAKKSFALRAPKEGKDNISFAAYIHPDNPTSGAYTGTSFVIFPGQEKSCLVGMVVGTGGLAPDEAILGKPGHARKLNAFCEWLNKTYGDGSVVAWSKQDPTRTDQEIPKHLCLQWGPYKSALDRYNNFLYAVFAPGANRQATKDAVAGFLDILLEERGFGPLKSFEASANTLRQNYFSCLMPDVDPKGLHRFLETRRFAILQGPPGSGKTRMALSLLRQEFQGNGMSIQFHPATTYENFVGGLAPVLSSSELGLRFQPVPGFLMKAAAAALANPDRPYLLHIDEINRADLAKILGEAIYLLEASETEARRISLPYDFGEPFHDTLFLPPNLRILGTMNSTDRSIAILDVAVRRRFGFLSLWPSIEVVKQNGSPLMLSAFEKLLALFVDHASDEAFSLLPGHSYFLESDPQKSAESLRANLLPLLEEYLAQGYVQGFAEEIRAYNQWLRTQ
jgi:5-methylcytosine-specific restriction enzyme B